LFFKHLFGFEFFISLLAARLFDTGTASLMAPKKKPPKAEAAAFWMSWIWRPGCDDIWRICGD